ncbi:hypothetical protein [Actinophytocola xanthii]|uniref:Uncharacterized protein n=1 Tax=Actinophytocola xanthii TaxID=1912961 RepID=A0A1Q8CWL7_9PSEU|nr:hypothetical protein [Actinophytocola xanthii]OLF18745.1 hypothetical protein BU204_04360 [Actinophytocola xanthii]
MNGRILVGLAAANLGLLFVADENLSQVAAVLRGGSTVVHARYAPVFAAVVGLLAWQLAPRRSWSWLLLAGALCAVPRALRRLEGGSVPLRVGIEQWFDAAAPVLTLIGILGAATLGWRAGHRGAAAALVGMAAALPLLPAALLHSYSPWFSVDLQPLLVAVCTGVGLLASVAAAVAVFVRTPPECPSPAWRVTLAGCLAAAAPLVTRIWEPLPPTRLPEDAILYRSLTFAALGLVAGVIAGRRVLLAATAVGLSLGIFGLAFLFALIVVFQTPALAALVLVVGVAAGVLLALPARRAAVGLAALVLVAAGLTVLFFQVDVVGAFATPTETMVAWLTPVLFPLAIVAAVTVAGAAGTALADRSATPAALAGLATPFALLALAVITLRWELQADARAQPPDILLLGVAGLGIAALALLGLTVAGRRPTLEAPRDEPDQQPAAVS